MLLVPTRVGMIPQVNNNTKKKRTCPHTRGDDPVSEFTEKIVNLLSPHAWG